MRLCLIKVVNSHTCLVPSSQQNRKILNSNICYFIATLPLRKIHRHRSSFSHKCCTNTFELNRFSNQMGIYYFFLLEAHDFLFLFIIFFKKISSKPIFDFSKCFFSKYHLNVKKISHAILMIDNMIDINV